MDTGEFILTIIALSLLVSWLILLIYYILKRLELSIWKIGFNFTAAFVILSVFISHSSIAYYSGYFSLTDLIAGLLFNLFWLLVPIIALLSYVVRRIKFGKKKALSDDEINKDLIYSESSRNKNTEKSLDISKSEINKQNQRFDFGQKFFRNKYFSIGILFIILVCIVIIGVALGKKQQPSKLVVTPNQPIITPSIQESSFDTNQIPLGFKEIGCEEGINNEVIIDTLFNIELEKAKIIYTKCFSNEGENDISFISEIILYPLTQGEINQVKADYQGVKLDLYLEKNPEISLLENYGDFGDSSNGFEMSKIEDDIPIHYQFIHVLKNDFFIIFIKIGLNNNDVIDFKSIILESIKNIEDLY